MEEMEEQRDVLIVRNMKPPFLDGDVHFTRQTEMVSTVKDPTSDFAKLARSGSAVLRHRRASGSRSTRTGSGNCRGRRWAS